jgi:hypothetical protein
MGKTKRFDLQFAEFIPTELEQGRLYISIPYATATHLCACGCGEKVITPFTPTDWSLIYDGETASLKPSIGNWSFPCRSHYVISRNRVRWAEDWSKGKVKSGRARDRRIKGQQFGEHRDSTNKTRHANADPSSTGLIQRLKGWIGLD